MDKAKLDHWITGGGDPDADNRGCDEMRGQKVIFTGQDQYQAARHDNAEGILVIGQEYEIESEETHSWHTHTLLVGVEGRFNSVCFVSDRRQISVICGRPDCPKRGVGDKREADGEGSNERAE